MATGTDTTFKVRNSLLVNNSITINSTAIYFGGAFTLNTTAYIGTANNASFLNNVAPSAYVNTSGNFTLAGNITINGITTLGANLSVSGISVFSGNNIFNANLVVNTALVANGSNGTSGQPLVTNGSGIYWGTIASNKVTGLAASATSDTTNASNISTGTLNVNRLPTGIPTSSLSGTLPAADITGLAPSATTDTTNASNITTGTLSATLLLANTGIVANSYGIYAPAIGGFINKFRNGTFIIAQRGTSGSVTSTNISYTLDGWQLYANGATAAWSQVNNNNLAGSALRVSCNSGLSNCIILQRIESYIASSLLTYSLAAQPITIQFAIYNNTGSSLTPQISCSWANTPDNFSVLKPDLSATSVQTITNGTSGILAYTFTPNTNLANGYQIDLLFGSGLNHATGYVDVGFADVRATPNLLTGTNSNPPASETRLLNSEFEFCARYYWDNANGLNNINGFQLATYNSSSVPSTTAAIYYPVPMRAAASATPRNIAYTGTSSGLTLNPGSTMCSTYFTPLNDTVQSVTFQCAFSAEL